jgi:Protein of unknown function (DUF2934)
MTALEMSTISARAYSIWEREGRPDGKALNHWLQAEAELISTSRVEDALTLEAAGPEQVATVKIVAAESRDAVKRKSPRKRSR